MPGRRRRPRVAFVHEAFPASLDYPSARPVRLLVERGDVDVVVHERRRGGLVPPPGLRLESGRGTVGIAARLVAERPDLLVVVASMVDLVLAPLGRRTWVVAPQRSSVGSRVAVQEWLMRRTVDLVSWQNPWESTRWRARPREVDLPAPVDVSHFASRPARDPAFWRDRGLRVPTGPVLVCVANVVPGKGHADLVEGLAPLLHERPGAALAFAGGHVDDGAVAELEAAVTRSGLDDRVLRLRRLDRDGVRQLYAWADLQVWATRAETQCMALYEGLAAGVPAVLPDLPSLTLAFPHLPVHRDAAELRAQVSALLDDPDRRRRLVERSADRVAWADVGRHDRLFRETVDEVLG